MAKQSAENIRRSQSARMAMTAYASNQGAAGVALRGNYFDPDCIITDILTDLRHYCALNGADFDKHLRRSADHFSEETAQ